MDEDGYPEDDELDRLRKWPYQDCLGALEYAQSLWRYPEYFTRDATGWRVSTGGWSGNESVIGALMENTMFWMLCWVSSRRGGHFEFELPRMAVNEKGGESK